MAIRGTWGCTYCGARRSGELPSADGCPQGLDGKHVWTLIGQSSFYGPEGEFSPYALVTVPPYCGVALSPLLIEAADEIDRLRTKIYGRKKVNLDRRRRIMLRENP